MHLSIKMKYLIFVPILLTFIVCAQNEDVENKHAESSSNASLNPKAYAAILTDRRRQHRQLTQQMLKHNYEKNHKLLKVGYTKIFELLNESNKTLTKHNYRPQVDGFAVSDADQLEALTIVLENCCLTAEFLMHFPEISYIIFKKTPFPNWKQTLNWCIRFVNAFPHIIDDSTAKLMELLSQEINEELRTADFVNPYYKKPTEDVAHTVRKQKKIKKKLKKGPQLSGGTHNEL